MSTFHENLRNMKFCVQNQWRVLHTYITDTGRVANSRIPIIRIYLNFENSQLLNRLPDFAQTFTVYSFLFFFIHWKHINVWVSFRFKATRSSRGVFAAQRRTQHAASPKSIPNVMTPNVKSVGSTGERTHTWAQIQTARPQDGRSCQLSEWTRAHCTCVWRETKRARFLLASLLQSPRQLAVC